MNKIKLIEHFFGIIGFRIIYYNMIDNKNGADCFVQKGSNKPVSVEIKTARQNKTTKAWKIDPVSEKRKNDDLIAVIVGNYVLIEPMDQHLKLCDKSGTRSITKMF